MDRIHLYTIHLKKFVQKPIKKLVELLHLNKNYWGIYKGAKGSVQFPIDKPLP